MLALVAFLIGQRVGIGSSTGDASSGAAGAPSAAGGAPAGGAVNISQMSPEERANRLFDRIMSYSEQGKQDSARFFAPMAIQAYQMLGTPDSHARYDIGMIGFVTGNAVLARAEADTILAKDKSHLLGLILAMKAAGLRNDAAARTQFEKRFKASEPAERAKKLKEYEDHASDIEAAMRSPRGTKP